MPRPHDTVILFMPAYRAERTLSRVVAKIPAGIVDDIIVVDDDSGDGIEAVARALGVRFFRNPRNLGYGGNVKVCLERALELGADIAIELHPDDQYDPAAIPAALAAARGGCDLVLGSRFTTAAAALRHGMPPWKYAINRLSTLPARAVLGLPLSDFHCGFRVYRRRLLERVPYRRNGDDYLFSFQIIAQARYAGCTVGEVPVVCRYPPGATQIGFASAMRYGAGASRTLAAYVRARLGRAAPIFETGRAGATAAPTVERPR